MKKKLDHATLAEVVRNTPLVSIDLVVHNARDEVLLGWRNNEPARHWWFVPGGRILKDETIAAAFRRLCEEELGAPIQRQEAEFLGVYEHFYDANFAAKPGFGTHYVVLGHRIRWHRTELSPPEVQHSRYRWFPVSELLAAPDVHPYSKAYFPA